MATVGYGQNISQAPLRINVAPAEDALVVDISGETYPRWALKGSGSIALSAGTIAPDAGIRRDGTGIVAITDGSNGYGDLFIRNTLAFSGTGPYKVRSETSNDLTLETTMANAIVFSTAQTPRWNISSSGHLLASTDNAYDIGASGANRPRNLYLAGVIYTPSINGPVLLPPANGVGDIGSSTLRFNNIYAYGDIVTSNGIVNAGNRLVTFYGIDFTGSSISYTLSGTLVNGYLTLRDNTNVFTLVQWKGGAPAEGNTSMLLLTTRGGVTSVQQVSLGGADSGGAGYRVLRVPN